MQNKTYINSNIHHKNFSLTSKESHASKRTADQAFKPKQLKADRNIQMASALPIQAFWTTLTIVAVFIFLVIVIAPILTKLLQLKSIQLIKEVREAQTEILRLHKEIFGVSHQEKEKICNQLHTEVAGKLSVLRLAWYRLQPKDSDYHIQTQHAYLMDELQRCEKAVLDVNNALLTDFHSFPQNTELLVDISNRCKELCFHEGMEFKLFKGHNTYWEELEIPIRTSLYFVIFECLNNCIKHAKASRFTVLFYQFAQEVHLILKDDGIGLKRSKTKSSLGLKLTERNIKRINGQITITAVPGEGTTIHCRIPKTTKNKLRYGC